jgi:hypothetical protein
MSQYEHDDDSMHGNQISSSHEDGPTDCSVFDSDDDVQYDDDDRCDDISGLDDNDC